MLELAVVLVLFWILAHSWLVRPWLQRIFPRFPFIDRLFPR